MKNENEKVRLISCFKLTKWVWPQEEREQLNEFKSDVASLNKRAKSIVQLKPRDPTSPFRGKLPIQAVCDFKQMEVETRCHLSHTLTECLCCTLDPVSPDRSPCTRATSARSSITHSPSGGRFWTARGTRPWCRPSASSCRPSTRRLWRACPGTLYTVKALFSGALQTHMIYYYRIRQCFDLDFDSVFSSSY